MKQILTEVRVRGKVRNASAVTLQRKRTDDSQFFVYRDNHGTWLTKYDD